MAAVLLATDGSEHARLATERAIELAEQREATLHVVCVVDRRKFGEPGLSSEEVATIQAEDEARDCVAEAATTAERRGLAVVTSVRHGVPHEVIVDYASEIGAEVVVVGEHGEHRGHLGGVGRKVADEAACEVVVVGS